ncbi:MAG: exopolysaccharide biosynthesis protein [Alphaproteobacteria bacterium]|nr:exopolysaccharide biosynthesis protein [Alphaproteobacteria bacterium]
MSERGALLPTLDRLAEGPRDSIITLADFLQGLQTRSYAFAVALLDLPNCIPTGIPWLSTITGIPMFLLVLQYFRGHPVPSLPAFIGCRGLPRGKLQHFVARARRHIERLENAVHPRREWWVTGVPRHLMLATWMLQIILLALPVPFDNLLPAWAILFFCLAQIESDGVMAMLGWLFTLFTVIWTVFLVIAGHAAIMAAIAAARGILFD